MSDFDPNQTSDATGQTQPGWYPDPGTGQLRWWDGQTWGQFQQAAAAPAPMATTSGSPQNTAAMAHYLGAGLLLFACGLNWIGPLVIYSGQGKTDAFVRDQAAEAFNFQLTVTIAAVISFGLVFVAIGLLLLPLVIIGGVIFGVMGGMAAGRGEWYRYPFSIKFVKP